MYLTEEKIRKMQLKNDRIYDHVLQDTKSYHFLIWKVVNISLQNTQIMIIISIVSAV